MAIPSLAYQPRSAENTILDVAVGIVMQHGKTLLAWRDAKRDQGGCYEFVGGKVEVGESPYAALQRELKEEINLSVTHAKWIKTIDYAYPSRTVRLWIFYIDQFEGEPIGLEGQSLYWVLPADIQQYPLPAANLPLIRLLQLPQTYAITPLYLTVDEAVLQAKNYEKNQWLYLRQPHFSEAQYLDYVAQVCLLRPDLKLVVQAMQADQVLAKSKTIRGVHVKSAMLGQPQTASKIKEYQDSKLCIFAATHTQAELERAANLGVDAALLSPVLSTPSHPEQDFLGWENWAKIVSQVGLPVYALGGLSLEDMDKSKAAGAWGLAGIRLFLQ